MNKENCTLSGTPEKGSPLKKFVTTLIALVALVLLSGFILAILANLKPTNHSRDGLTEATSKPQPVHKSPSPSQIQIPRPILRPPVKKVLTVEKRDAWILDESLKELEHLIKTCPMAGIHSNLLELLENGTIKIEIPGNMTSYGDWGMTLGLAKDNQGLEYYRLELNPYFILGNRYAKQTPYGPQQVREYSDRHRQLALIHEFEHYRQISGDRGEYLQEIYRETWDGPDKMSPKLAEKTFELEFLGWLQASKAAKILDWRNEHPVYEAFIKGGGAAFAEELVNLLSTSSQYTHHRATIARRARALVKQAN